MMKKKNILIMDPVGVKAGMDYYNDNLADAIKRNLNIDVFIASNYDTHERCVKCFSSSGGSKLSKIKDLYLGAYNALRFAKKRNVSHVIIHCFSFELKDLLFIRLIRLFNFHLITVAHDISGFAQNDSSKIRDLIFNRYSTNIVIQNLFSLSKIKELVSQSTVSKIALIPHGHFLNLPDPNVSYSSARERLGIPMGQKTILFFGQIKKVKGLDVLINALPYCANDIKLVIAGKPWKDDFEKYQNLIDSQSLGNRVVQKIHYISDAERELLFKAADLIVIPYREIFQSGVLLMAMSYNKVVIASDLPANKEIVEDARNGYLFISQNSVALGEKIEFIFKEDVQVIQRILDNANEKLKKDHSWDKISFGYKAIIDIS